MVAVRWAESTSISEVSLSGEFKGSERGIREEVLEFGFAPLSVWWRKARAMARRKVCEAGGAAQQELQP